jgi:hypothetical protein
VIGTLRTVGSRLAERAAQAEGRLQAVAVDAHEGVPEAMDAAVALIPRSRVRAERRRLVGLPDVEPWSHARDEAVREPGAAAGIVAARQHVLKIRERELPCERVRPTDGVHDAVAVREREAALPPDRGFDGLDLGPWIVPIVDEDGERPGVAIPRCIAQQPVAVVEPDCSRSLVAAVIAQREDGGRPRGESGEAEEKEQGGPPSRAARASVARLYLIVNFACPVETLPLMSVASHLNVVVVLTTKD